MEDSVRPSSAAIPHIEVGDISTTGGRLSFMVRNPAQIDAAVERMRNSTRPVALTGQPRLGRPGGRFDAHRSDPNAERHGQALKDAMSVARDVVRRRIDPGGTKEITVITEGGDRILVQVPGRRGPRSAQEIDRPDRAARVQARRPVGQSAGRPAGPRPARQPGAADGRRHRRHGGQAPGDGVGRPADRRPAGLRPGRPAGHQHQVQHRRRPPLRPGHAGKYRQAVRDHPRRQDPVGAEHQRADPRRQRPDHGQLHGPERARPRGVARLGQIAGQAERDRGADRRPRPRQGFDPQGRHRQRRRHACGDRSSCSSPTGGSASMRTSRWS